MNRWLKQLNQLNFDKKMQLFISISITITATIIIIISAISANTSLTDKSRNLVQIQINTLSDNLQMNLEYYYNTANTILRDDQVQNYLKSSEEELGKSPVLINNVRNNLISMLNMQSHINFIVIVKDEDSEYLYKGVQSLPDSQFVEKYTIDYEQSVPSGYGSMRISINDAYFDAEHHSITFYQPIYDKSRIGNRIGELIINIDENGLFKAFQGKKQGTTELEENLIGIDGSIAFYSDHTRIGQHIGYMDKIVGNNGSFQLDDKLYVYEKLGKWNYYLVSYIPMAVLTQDSIRTTIILIAIVVLMVFCSLIIGMRIIKKTYKPLDELIGKMSNVSTGMLDARMNEEKMGNDFVTMAQSFNLMMERLNALVKQVKEDQHRVEQIRFNALQSQIKPHFLYNTLECIHWQALMDGNEVVSTLVKSLATYYRLCLSKGQDIIPLSQELAHIESYITIQNMRYDNIIKSKINIKNNFFDVLIPKMTLQPLVENAIYHGIRIREGEKGCIEINAFEEKKGIIIQVIDSGNGMTQEAIEEINNSISVHDESFGYGIRNVNKRIEILFGDEYGLKYKGNESGGITVDICLPRNYEQVN